MRLDFNSFGRSKEYDLVCDSNVRVHVSRIPLKEGYSLVTAYIMNRRKNPENNLEALMFQVNIKAYDPSEDNIFIAEHLCRKVLVADEFYFEQRPIMGRGRGCAATWGTVDNGTTNYVQTDFIPQYEFPGVSAALPGFDPFFFSMRGLSVKQKKDDIIGKLNVLADAYENWIHEKLNGDYKMTDSEFASEVGNHVISECNKALDRIREGITLLVENDSAFEALTTWADAPEGKIKKSDVTVAKNYLSQDEMKQLNRMVTAYLDFAENMTLRHIPLTMQDWEKRLNSFIEMFDYGILQDAGKVSAEIAKLHAETEFEKYRVIQDRLFMSDFDKYMLELEENTKK